MQRLHVVARGAVVLSYHDTRPTTKTRDGALKRGFFAFADLFVKDLVTMAPALVVCKVVWVTQNK